MNHLNPALCHEPFSKEDVSLVVSSSRPGHERLAPNSNSPDDFFSSPPPHPRLPHLKQDMKLWKGQAEIGKRWVEISNRNFKGSRSENHLKNRWYSATFKKFVREEFGEGAYASMNASAS